MGIDIQRKEKGYGDSFAERILSPTELNEYYILVYTIISNIILWIFTRCQITVSICQRCGYINTIISKTTSEMTYRKRHIKHVDGHYDYDEIKSTTTYNTSGSNSADIVDSYGIRQGVVRSSANYRTTEETKTVVKFCVDAYDIDEGHHEHTVTNNDCRCRCCGCFYSYKFDFAKRID